LTALFIVSVCLFCLCVLIARGRDTPPYNRTYTHTHLYTNTGTQAPKFVPYRRPAQVP
jgi:hypothetical protein